MSGFLLVLDNAHFLFVHEVPFVVSYRSEDSLVNMQVVKMTGTNT